jgi:DNA processing protein
VPGLADASEGAGCNALIREGAVLCRSVEDILEELQGYSAALRRPAEPVPTSTPAPAPARAAAPTSGPPAGLNEGQRVLWTFLSEPRHLDEIVQNLALSVSSASMMLLTLEMKRIVRRLPGSRYERC